MEVWLYQPNKEPLQIEGYVSIPEANTELTRSDNSVLIQYQTPDKEYAYASIDINVLYPVALKEVIPPSVDKGQGKYKLNTSEMKYNLEYNDGSLIEVSNDSLTTDPSSVTETNGALANDSLVKYSVTHNATLLKFTGRMFVNPMASANGGSNIVTFASGSWEEIGKLMKQNADGEIILADYWKIGDERRIKINGKIYTMVILDLDKTTSGGTKYNAAIGFKELMDFCKQKLDVTVDVKKAIRIDGYTKSGSYTRQDINNYNYSYFIPDDYSRYYGREYNKEASTIEINPIMKSDNALYNLLPPNIRNIIINCHFSCKSNYLKMSEYNDQNARAQYDITHIDGKILARLYWYIELFLFKIDHKEQNYIGITSSEDIVGNRSFSYYSNNLNRIKTLNGVNTKYHLRNSKWADVAIHGVKYFPDHTYELRDVGGDEVDRVIIFSNTECTIPMACVDENGATDRIIVHNSDDNYKSIFTHPKYENDLYYSPYFCI